MKCILVPTDFSAYADYATSFAVKLAKKMNAHIQLYHLVDLPPEWKNLNGKEKLKYPETNQKLDRIEKELEKVKSKYIKEGVEMEVAYKNRGVDSAFKTLTDDPSVDLVIMGSHGSSGSNTTMMGSNAQLIVRHAKCPVMVIKSPVKSLQFKHVIFASNFNLEARKAFLEVVQFAKLFDAEIHLLTINAPSFFNAPRFVTTSSMMEFKNLAKDIVCHIHDIPDMNVEEGIENFAKEIQADLITIGTYGRNAVSRIFIGSVAESLVNHVTLPIMTFNIHR